MSVAGHDLVRRTLDVTGRVQGVGFRPFVYRLARDLHLGGHVRNTPAGVEIELVGPAERIDAFIRRLPLEKPLLAEIRSVTRCDRLIDADSHAETFDILTSALEVHATAEVTPDLALCDACLRDIRSAHDRRSGYALTNCTDCGPRYSIVRDTPYDRATTTMTSFAMCEACEREYHDPADRRFHAQPTACPACGPKVQLLDAHGTAIAGAGPIRAAADLLISGFIVAIKGLGGFHLACRADDVRVVDRLRRLKARPTKPFALMARSLDVARALIELDATSASLLASPAAPIVLAARRNDPRIATNIAPGMARLGVMLAYTPLHHLLFDAMPLDVLVMTSANDGDMPMTWRDASIVAELGGLCDAVLTHDRPIERPVDDSVVLSSGMPTRRARGYAPTPIELPFEVDSPGIALGGELKNTITLVRGRQAIVSQHLGDLGHLATYQQFERTIGDLCRLFEIKPEWVAHDLHPTYTSTRHSKRMGLHCHAVQHHYAHAAAVLAEHGHTGAAIAIVCDGTGFGPDRTIWGGEVLLCDLQHYQRVDHLTPFQLPGGDASARHPWRSALALIHHARLHDRFDVPTERSLVVDMLDARSGCTLTTSTGRLFDGVASLLNVCHENRFESEAPSLLESLAATCEDPVCWKVDGLDVASVVRQVVDSIEQRLAVPLIARRFHNTLSTMLARSASRAAAQGGVRTVALSGGTMCNVLLADLLARSLEADGFTVLRHRVVPPNDGGLSFGQAAVLSAQRRVS
jgi:hydrogenase maturation protein HypF